MGIGSILNTTGGKSFSFSEIGASVTGTVMAADVVQKRNFDSGELEFWDDGKPIEQVRITLETNLRDASDPDDDGARSVYVKGWGDQLRELRRAVKASGGEDIEAGGTFTATYVRDGEIAKGKRGFPPKVYAYEYKAPSGTSSLLGGQRPAPVQQAAPQPVQQAPAPAAAPAPAPAPAAAPQQDMAALLAAMTPEQQAALAAFQQTQQKSA